MQTTYHVSVLTKELVTYLLPQSGKGLVIVDATFGGGGHTRALLEHDPTCTVVSLDWDQKALDQNSPALKEEFGKRFIPIWGNFAHLYILLKKNKIPPIHGICADFGTSQYQIHNKAGFSFQKESLLDMRMSPSHNYLKASDVVNKYAEAMLSKIFFTLADEAYARQIAKAIAERRDKQPFTTTTELAQLIEQVIPKRIWATKKIHPATKVFQALRMYVNKEMENMQLFLNAALTSLQPQGRFVCISFHSLEDRTVKTFFQQNQNQLTILTPKPITAREEEKSCNPSSRSAKLRAAEKN